MQTASQIEAIAQVHGLQLQALASLPVVSVVQGIVASLAARFGVEIRSEVPAPSLVALGPARAGSGGSRADRQRAGAQCAAAPHRARAADLVRVLARTDGLDIRIENSGTLPEDFDLGAIGQGAQGLPLVKSLLPRRGARLSMVPVPGGVLTRLELVKPAIREETAA